MDYESIKRLGLDHIGIDPNMSFETYDPSNANHNIFIHLLKQDEIICPLCGVYNNYTNKGTRSQLIKYSCALENNITIKLFRRAYQCKDCGHYFKETNPFLQSRKKISLNKDLKILDELRDFNRTYTSIAKSFDVSPTYVVNLFDKKVDLKRLELPELICVDEVYSKKLSYHHYCFTIYDPIGHKIIDVLDSRHQEDLYGYFGNIPVKERNNVKYFSMDLYESYRIIAKKCFPNAIICADSFHVIKNLTQHFHKIRIRIMKSYSYLKHQNDTYYWLYKKYWKLLSKDTSKISHRKFKVSKTNQFMSCAEIIDNMLTIDKDLKLAYELLHEYRTFNEKATLDNAAEWLDELTLRYKNSNISECIQSGILLSNWRNEIINSFNRVNGIRVSNGPMERANRDIKTLFRMSFGSSNFIRMRNRIMYTMNSDSPILYNRKTTTNKNNGRPRGHYRKHK